MAEVMQCHFSFLSQKIIYGEFAGGLVVRTLVLLLWRVWVQTLVGELRSHKSHGIGRNYFISIFDYDKKTYKSVKTITLNCTFHKCH